jgi:phage antirepressor YoqD-like protein
MQVTINNELTVEVVPNVEHDWLLSTKDVAEGYGLSSAGIRKTKERYSDELEEGKHWVVTDSHTLGGVQKTTMWTKRGVVRLGFFIKTPMAKEFRDWAEDYIIEGGAKAKAQPTPTIPQTFSEALLLAAEQARMLELQAPKVEVYEDIMSKETTHSVNDVAKMVGLKATKIMKFLLHKGFVYKRVSGGYKPYSKHDSKGYFKVKLVQYNEDSNSAQVRFTAKGVELMRTLADEYDAWYMKNYGTTGKKEYI